MRLSGLFLLPVLALWMGMGAAQAQFRVDVSGVGLTQVPIALSPFRGEDASPQRIASIVQADLERSGMFRALAAGQSLDENARPDMSAMRQRGAEQVIVISAVGADASSAIFYSRVKGDMEHELATLGYPSVTILRPSLLLGKRTPTRPKEVALEMLFRVLGPLIPRAWRGVTDTAVAHTMIDAMHHPQSGVRVITNAEMVA